MKYNLQNTKYLYEKLVDIIGKENVFMNPNQFNVLFPKPSLEMIQKYQLMPVDTQARACVLQSVTKELIDQFAKEYKSDSEIAVKIEELQHDSVLMGEGGSSETT